MLIGVGELVARIMSCIVNLSRKKALAFIVVNEFILSFIPFIFILGGQQLSQIVLP